MKRSWRGISAKAVSLWSARNPSRSIFEGLWFPDAFRVDLFIQRTVVVEIKSVAALVPAHHKQLLTYVRLLECPAGLLLNFGATQLRDGLKRVLNTPPCTP